MAKKVIKAKNVVSFHAAEAEEPVVETARKPKNPLPPADPIETAPLNMRKNRYLDETPQDADWADEEPLFEEYEDGEDTASDSISTFAEVFIPLHNDSTGTVIRKGMVLVSVIVILCCLVAILMKHGAVSAVLTSEVSAWTDTLTGAILLWNP